MALNVLMAIVWDMVGIDHFGIGFGRLDSLAQHNTEPQANQPLQSKNLTHLVFSILLSITVN